MKNPGNKKQRALALFKKNDLVKAKSLYVKLCRDNSSDPELYYMLGIVNGRMGLYEEATTALNKAISLRPDVTISHLGLANALSEQGKIDEAKSSVERALQLQPNAAEAHSLLGHILSLQNNLEDAQASCEKAIKLNPNLADAHHGLGEIKQHQRDFNKAIEHYRSALTINPNVAITHYRLGYCFYNNGKLDEAADQYRKALEIDKKLFEALKGLGTVLALQGEFEDAKKVYQETLTYYPNNIDAVVGMASTCELEKNFQQAYTYLKPHIESRTKHIGMALTYARLCANVDRCDDAIEFIEELLTGNLEIKHSQGLHSAVGKIYDSQGNYDKAFEHYHQGNSLRTSSYDLKIAESATTTLINTFDKDMLAKCPRAEHDTSLPIFIVGMPRSGTSLIEQILASHSSVFGAGELTDIGTIVSTLPKITGEKSKYPRCITNLTQDQINSLSKDYLDRLRTFSSDATLITDKMPHNFMHLGLISLLFPQARIIHCLRNPMDTCVSIYFQSFNATHTYANDLRSLGHHYREYEKIMAHWQKVIDLPILDLQYEELVNNQEKLSRQLVEFCGLEWEAGCLQFHKSERYINTASYKQVQQPIYKKSVERWKHYEPHLDPLKNALGID